MENNKVKLAMNIIMQKATPEYSYENYHNWNYPRVKGYPMQKLSIDNFKYIKLFFKISGYHNTYLNSSIPSIGVNKNEEMIIHCNNDNKYKIDMTSLGYTKHEYLNFKVNDLLNLLEIKNMEKIKDDEDMANAIRILNLRLKFWLKDNKFIKEGYYE